MPVKSRSKPVKSRTPSFERPLRAALALLTEAEKAANVRFTNREIGPPQLRFLGSLDDSIEQVRRTVGDLEAYVPRRLRG
jgi:hypothetical protein